MGNVIKLSSPATREFWEIPVLFADEHLLALDKPGGLLTCPDPDQPNRPDLMTLLHAGIAEGKAWAQERALTYLVNAHRLEPEVSGVLLLVRSKPVLEALANFFGSTKPGQSYVALVQGTPPDDRFEVDAKVGPYPGRPGFMRVDPKHGKRSQTRFEVLRRFTDWALLKCEPLTNRPHQIRVHLRSAGLPIVADPLYGGRPLYLSQIKRAYHLKPNQTERPLIGQLALHAESLALEHPVTAAPLTIAAPWPKDLTVAVKYLKRYAGL